MSYVNNMFYVNNISSDMSYINYMSIFMNHLKSNIFFTKYKGEVEY